MSQSPSQQQSSSGSSLKSMLKNRLGLPMKTQHDQMKLLTTLQALANIVGISGLAFTGRIGNQVGQSSGKVAGFSLGLIGVSLAITNLRVLMTMQKKGMHKLSHPAYTEYVNQVFAFLGIFVVLWAGFKFMNSQILGNVVKG